jgi:glycerol-3-phosphate O-acyltransferase
VGYRHSLFLAMRVVPGSGIVRAQWVRQSRQTDSLGDIIRMDDLNAILMTYYRNNILHLFAIPSLISRVFANSHTLEQQDVINSCRIFYPYLKSELFLQWNQEELDSVIIHWLSALADAGLITADGTLWSHSESGSIGFVTLTILSRPIQPALERFYVVISLLLRNGSGQVDAESLESQSRDMAQRLSATQALGATGSHVLVCSDHDPACVT